jgi:alginate O-acetyltransferase complex protein AlgI
MKVFKGMAGQSGVLLPRFLGNLPIVGDLDFAFGKTWLAGIQGKDQTVIYLLIAFIVVLTAKNSIQMTDSFKPSWRSFLFLVVIAFYTLLNMSKVSEFLYFQF